MPESQTAVPMLLGGRAAGAGAPAARRSLPGPALRLLPDERLARLASNGDRAAFGVIFNRYHQELHRYCISILRNAEDAGDALQSTMLRALNALEGDDREIALRPWLYRIAHNESITLLRRRVRTAKLRMPARSDEGAEVRADVRELLGDLRELPERQRGALVMRELGGLEYSEIADAFDTTPTAAKQATYDARRALHELAKGRAMACSVVSAAISDGDGRALRSRALRAHLRACGDCRSFSTGIADRQAKLAALVPAMPSAAAAGLLESVVGAATGGGGGAGLVAGVGVPFATKSIATAALVAALGAGALQVAAPGNGDGGARPSRATPLPAPAAGTPSVLSGPSLGVVHGHPARHARPGGSAVSRKPHGASGAHPGAGSTQAPPVGATHVSTPSIEQAPAVATPAPAASSETERRGPFRNLGSGHSGGSHPIRRSVGIVVGHPDLPATVDHVRDVLPVKLPPPPLAHPKRERHE